MTGPERADTKQMRATSEAIEAMHQQMQDGTAAIVDLIGQYEQAMREDGLGRELRRLAAALQESDRRIHDGMRQVGRFLGDTAADIDAMVAQGQTDLAAVAKQLEAGGKYGAALNSPASPA